MRKTQLWIMPYILLCLLLQSHAALGMAQETANNEEEIWKLKEQAHEINKQAYSEINKMRRRGHASIDPIMALYDKMSVLLDHPGITKQDLRQRWQGQILSELAQCISDQQANPEGRQNCQKTALAIFAKWLAHSEDEDDRIYIATKGKELVEHMTSECTHLKDAFDVYQSMAVLNTHEEIPIESGGSMRDFRIREQRSLAAQIIFLCAHEKNDESLMLSIYNTLADIGNHAAGVERCSMIKLFVEYYCALGRLDDAEKISLDFRHVYFNEHRSLDDYQVIVAAAIAEARAKAKSPQQPKLMEQMSTEAQALALGRMADTQARAGNAGEALSSLKKIGELKQGKEVRYIYGRAAANLIGVFIGAGDKVAMREAYLHLNPLCKEQSLEAVCADVDIARIAATEKSGDMREARKVYDELAASLRTKTPTEEHLGNLARATVILICNYAEKKDQAGAREIFQAFLKNPGGMESLEKWFGSSGGSEAEIRRVYDGFAVLSDDAHGRIVRHMVGLRYLDELLEDLPAAENFLSELAGLGKEKEIRIRQAQAAFRFIKACSFDSKAGIEAAERVFAAMKSLGNEDEIRLQQSKAAALLCYKFAMTGDSRTAGDYYIKIKDDRTASDDEMKELKKRAKHRLEEASLLQLLQRQHK